MFSKGGRDIRNSELVISSKGRVAVQTVEGGVLWEPSLSRSDAEVHGVGGEGFDDHGVAG